MHFVDAKGILSSDNGMNVYRGCTYGCFSFCAKQVDYLRIDTHSNNLTMQNAIKKFGFEQCGKIFVRNGERIAYDYIKSE